MKALSARENKKSREGAKCGVSKGQNFDSGSYTSQILSLHAKIGNIGVRKLLSAVRTGQRPGSGAASSTDVSRVPGLASGRLPGTGSLLPVFIQRRGARSGSVSRVNEDDLATFLSQYEDFAASSPAIAKKYLTHPDLLRNERNLQQRILRNWLSGSAPLSVSQVAGMAKSIMSDQGTALLMCHNVIRSFARGGRAIPWKRSFMGYSDGARFYMPRKIHKAGVLYPKSSGGRPSLFYLLFSPTQFGTADPGAWYHYFAMATAAFYTASGRAGLSGTLTRRGTLARGYRNLVQVLLRDAMTKMWGGVRFNMRYWAWRRANAISFLEGAFFGRSQPEISRESRVHLKGAVNGIRSAGMSLSNRWIWYVPKYSLLKRAYFRVSACSTGIFPWNLSTYTYEKLDMHGNRI